MKRLLLAVLLLPAVCFSQKNSFDYYDRKTGDAVNGFYQTLTTSGAWPDFERELRDLMGAMDEDLQSGSGFSFEQMNELRKRRLVVRTLQEFGEGISPDGYTQAFNGHMLALIQVLFPEISCELYASYEDCVSVYKVSFRSLVVFTARHNKRGTMMKISWHDAAISCKTIGGNFNMLGGFYKRFWDNSRCLSVSSPRILVTACDFYAFIDQRYAPVKSFLDE